MPTDHDSIVDARLAYRRWRVEQWGPFEKDGKTPLRQPNIKAAPPQPEQWFCAGYAAGVESLVAENARLRSDVDRLGVRASDLTKAVRECADDRTIQRNLPILHGYLVGLLAEYPPTIAEQHALKGDD